MIHVAIAEDQLLFRSGIVQIINNFKDVRVVIESQNGQELLQSLKATTEKIHVAMIDMNMPEMNGLECLVQLKEQYPEIRVIFLTVFEDERLIAKFIEAGANAYLGKNSETSEVEKTIRKVVENDYYFSETTIKAMHSKVRNKQKTVSNPALSALTKREREVLELICREHTSDEIAKKLFISESTVNGHRNNLLLKLSCRNTAGLVLFAVKSGLIEFN
jgi:DNA-binding NarL/FixJ family response regulator